MLATDIPLREHSHLDLRASNSDPLALEDRLCPGCKNSVVNEQGGLVVAFGQSFFHVDCFKCAKCRNQVTADTNLLLLSDGSPICANCSYSCNICHLPILDEAIMTGDDSYHAHCFKCKVCSNRIDELVFAKTSQGIYCMNCHNERMIKIRKHAQKKAEREKLSGGSASSKPREYDALHFHRDQDRQNSGENPRSGSMKSLPPSAIGRSEISSLTENIDLPTRPSQDSHINNNTSSASIPSYSQSAVSRSHDHPVSLFSPAPLPSQPPSTTVVSYSVSEREPKQKASPESQGSLKSNTLPLTPLQLSVDFKRRNSHDDGTRPLNVLPRQDSLSPDYRYHLSRTSSNSSAEAPLSTPRGDKRRSINPGLFLPPLRDVSLSHSSNLLTRHGSSLGQELNVSPTSPYLTLNGQTQQAAYTARLGSGRSSYSSPTGSLPSPDHTERLPPPLSTRRSLNDESLNNSIVMSPPAMLVDPESPIELSQPSPSGDDDIQLVKSQKTGSDQSSIALNLMDPRRVSSTSSRSIETNHSGRSSSRADVPRGVESGTDTEPENDSERLSSDVHNPLPPVPPPKDTSNLTNASSVYHDADLDSSEALQLGDIPDDMGESLAVERMSHTTFIAPALPPIRFSMNAGEFSELLSSVGGLPSLKSLDSLAKLTRESQGLPSTPSTTASLINSSTNKQIGPDHLNVADRNEAYQVVPSNILSSSTLTIEEPESESAQTVASEPSENRKLSREIFSDSSPRHQRMPLESNAVIVKLRDTLSSAQAQGARYLNVDIDFVEAIVDLLESRDVDYSQLKNRVDGMNRESKRYIDGLTVAQAEYDRELKARRDAEAEVTRLRVLLSGQAVRITALSGDTRRQELRQQLSKELNDNLSDLEHDLSRLKVERDVTLAEIEELSTKKSIGISNDVVSTNLGRSLTKRLESIRNQYQRELEPLTMQKASLTREVAELKAVRDVFLEETAVLNARNEELAQLSAVYARRIDNIPETPAKGVQDAPQQALLDASRSQLPSNVLAPSLSTSTSGSSTIYDENQEPKSIKSHRSENELHTPAKPKFKWPGSKSKDFASPAPITEFGKNKARLDHNFQQLSILRFTRCDHCGDKMWGSQLRCTVCSTSIHVRCISNVQTSCSQPQHHNVNRDEQIPLQPSVFGRDLTEQVHADSKDEERQVPIIVEKCIEAVEARALDYEGIYRKTGGSGQSKAITQMFERGDYASFDLCDSDRFNDICSVTSVLKAYFRSLPIPLLTFDLHDQLTAASAIKDPFIKHQTLNDLVHKLPQEHFFTLRMLMLHLHRIHKRSERNLMNARNLGVVFGPTLMRSRDAGAEFSDMAGKALSIEWLIENAPQVFDFPE